MFAELRAIRRGTDELLRTQVEILTELRSLAPTTQVAGPPLEPLSDVFPELNEHDEVAAPSPRPFRTRHRQKTILLVDDDEEARRAALAALEGAQIPVRGVGDGNSALAAIAEEKPDVIVMELGMSGAMAGKDVINMIKATMEWVDIPIVLYTRIPIASQKEARTIHGGDEWVPKGPEGLKQLVTCVIQLFQKSS